MFSPIHLFHTSWQLELPRPWEPECSIDLMIRLCLAATAVCDWCAPVSDSFLPASRTPPLVPSIMALAATAVFALGRCSPWPAVFAPFASAFAFAPLFLQGQPTLSPLALDVGFLEEPMYMRKCNVPETCLLQSTSCTTVFHTSWQLELPRP